MTTHTIKSPLADIPVSTVKSTVMTITPELAMKWLDTCNTHNRPLRQSVVEEYTAAMAANRWRLNGESIIFDKTGRLANGQHRLWACVESKVPFEAVVVTDVEPDTFVTLDQGARRSPGDMLYIDNPKAMDNVNRSTVGAAAMLVWQYRNKNLFSNAKLPASDLVRLVNEEPTLIDWCREARRAGKGLKGFATPVAATLHIGSKGYPERAIEFVQRFIDGQNLGAGHPVLALRARIVANPPHRGWERLYMTVAAWNAFTSDRKLQKINAQPRADEFPQIKGE